VSTIFDVFISLLSLSFACGFVLFTLIPRLDLGAAIVVIACVYFDFSATAREFPKALVFYWLNCTLPS